MLHQVIRDHMLILSDEVNFFVYCIGRRYSWEHLHICLRKNKQMGTRDFIYQIHEHSARVARDFIHAMSSHEK